MADRRRSYEGPTPEEAYGSVAGEMYVPGEEGYETPEQTLAGLDEEIVELAKAYADATYAPWPPAPAGGILMTVWSIEG